MIDVDDCVEISGMNVRQGKPKMVMIMEQLVE
jgi:hypothetical protein